MIDISRAGQSEMLENLQNGVTLLDFNASWCRPCRAQEIVIRRLDRVFGARATIATINIDENAEMAIQLGIQSIPTLVLYKEGKELRRFIGLQTEKTLVRAITEALK